MNYIYTDLKGYFSKINNVIVNEGKGAQGIKFNGKMFAMFHKGDLLLKYSPERVQELVKSGHGVLHDPGTGKPMKDRILIPASKSNSWIGLASESLEYVKSLIK